MTLIELKAENFMGLKAVRVRPTGAVTRIVGENEAGKTSVLDAISAALGGADRSPDLPIHRGKTKAVVIADLGDIIVTRKWSQKGGSTLEITSKDGERKQAPQQLLNSLMGRLSFDPLDFSRMKPTEQAATLAQIAGLDLGKLATERQQLFGERTAANRQAKDARSQLAGIAPAPAGTPDVEESVTAILDELKAAQEHNRTVEAANRAAEVASQEANAMLERFERARDLPGELADQRDKEIERVKADYAAKIETAKEMSLRLGETAEKLQAKATELATDAGKLIVLETATLQDRASKAEAVNRAVWAKRSRASKEAEAVAHEKRSDELSKKLDALEERKSAALEKAKFPVDGLAISEAGVTIDDIPFAQCSGAQRLRTSVGIGLALNPTLKLMLIRDGSLLDEKSMAMLAEMAEAAGAQVLIERVASAGEVGVRIVDGETVDEPAEDRKAA